MDDFSSKCYSPESEVSETLSVRWMFKELGGFASGIEVAQHQTEMDEWAWLMISPVTYGFHHNGCIWDVLKDDPPGDTGEDFLSPCNNCVMTVMKNVWDVRVLNLNSCCAFAFRCVRLLLHITITHVFVISVTFVLLQTVLFGFVSHGVIASVELPHRSQQIWQQTAMFDLVAQILVSPVVWIGTHFNF